MIDKPGAGMRPPSVLSSNAIDFGRVRDVPDRELTARRLLASILQRRRLLFAVWAGFAICVALFTILTPKKYTVSAKLIAGGNGASEQAANTDPNGTNLPILNALLAATGQQSSTQIAELLQQEPVSQQVIKQLGLKTDVGTLLSHLTVRPVTDTAIVTLSVTWRDPQTAAQIANAYASVFVDRERQLVASQADSAIGYLEKELPIADEHMQAEQSALLAYQEKTGIADLATQTQNALASEQALETKLSESEVAADTAAASLAQVQSNLGSTPETIVAGETESGNPVSQSLQARVADLSAQLAAARKQYTDSFPAVITLKSQLIEAQRQLAAAPETIRSASSTGPNPVYQALQQSESALSGQLAAAQASIENLKAQIAAYQPEIAALPSVSRRLLELQRNAKQATDVHTALEQRRQDALIARTTALSDVTITQDASPNVFSVAPNAPLNLLLGIVVGLVLGISAVFLADFFDDRFRSEEDVKDRLGLPVLASIPLVDGLATRDQTWIRPLAVESFYQLVAALRYSSSTPPRIIAFTSADEGDGKSTIALNTAISLGQMKARVLLVDADLRRPTLHTKLGTSNDAGLSDVIVGVATLDQTVRPTEHAGVSLLSSGRPAPNPVGLLQSDAFDRVLRSARDAFDFVIVDAPALRSIVDGVVLAVKAEGTVLVVSSTSSEARGVRAAVEKLGSISDVNLLGVVLNRIDPDRRAAASYYLGSGQTVSLPPEVPA